MSYQVNIDVVDTTKPEGLHYPAITGGIWVPPPADGSNPGAPTFSGTMTNGKLTFPTLDGPPTGTSAMLVSQPAAAGDVTAFGDLFRSGPVATLPASPATLFGLSKTSPALGQSDLNNLTSNFAAMTIEVPGYIAFPIAAATGGWIFPVQITVSSAALTLGPPAPAGSLSLTLTGTMQVYHWFWTDNYPVALTEFLSLAPTGDPVDTSHILTATYASPGISMPGPYGYAIKPLAPLVAGYVTPKVEAMVNQAIPPQVAQALAEQTPPQQLAPQAVISANIVAVTSSEVTLTLTMADIFGEELVNLPTTTVPGVVGDTLQKAGQAMAAAQLKMYVVADSAPTGEVNYVPIVEFQDPDAGQIVPVGSEVVVTVKAYGKPHEPVEEQAPAAGPESAEPG